MITPATYSGPVWLPCGHVVDSNQIATLKGVCKRITLINDNLTVCNRKFNPNQVIRIQAAKIFCLDLAGKMLGAFLVICVVWYYGYFEREKSR